MSTQNDFNGQADQKLLLRARGLRTLRAFAELLGVSYSAVYLWESGSTRPTVDRIMQWMNSDNAELASLGKQLFDLRRKEAAAMESKQ